MHAGPTPSVGGGAARPETSSTASGRLNENALAFDALFGASLDTDVVTRRGPRPARGNDGVSSTRVTQENKSSENRMPDLAGSEADGTVGAAIQSSPESASVVGGTGDVATDDALSGGSSNGTPTAADGTKEDVVPPKAANSSGTGDLARSGPRVTFPGVDFPSGVGSGADGSLSAAVSRGVHKAALHGLQEAAVGRWAFPDGTGIGDGRTGSFLADITEADVTDSGPTAEDPGKLLTATASRGYGRSGTRIVGVATDDAARLDSGAAGGRAMGAGHAADEGTVDGASSVFGDGGEGADEGETISVSETEATDAETRAGRGTSVRRDGAGGAPSGAAPAAAAASPASAAFLDSEADGTTAQATAHVQDSLHGNPDGDAVGEPAAGGDANPGARAGRWGATDGAEPGNRDGGQSTSGRTAPAGLNHAENAGGSSGTVAASQFSEEAGPAWRAATGTGLELENDRWRGRPGGQPTDRADGEVPTAAAHVTETGQPGGSSQFGPGHGQSHSFGHATYTAATAGVSGSAAPAGEASFGQTIAAQLASPLEDIVAEMVRAPIVEDNVEQVSIRLRPEFLGEVVMRISVDADGVVTARFLAEHSFVRNMIEQHLPELRASLSEHGLQLGDASVGGGDAGFASEDGASPDGALRSVAAPGHTGASDDDEGGHVRDDDHDVGGVADYPLMGPIAIDIRV